jgi:hypothetical protein
MAVAGGEGTVINRDQLKDLQALSAANTTTTTLPPCASIVAATSRGQTGTFGENGGVQAMPAVCRLIRWLRRAKCFEYTQTLESVVQSLPRLPATQVELTGTDRVLSSLAYIINSPPAHLRPEERQELRDLCGKAIKAAIERQRQLMKEAAIEERAVKNIERHVASLPGSIDSSAPAATIDNDSREQILRGEVTTITGMAGQIFRPTPNADNGIDGEVEFKDYQNQASGKRVYLQLKSGDSHLKRRQRDGKEIFAIKKARHAEYWTCQAYPVMLVIRTSDGSIRWMDITAYLKACGHKLPTQIVFEGDPFTPENLLKLRDSLIPPPA